MISEKGFKFAHANVRSIIRHLDETFMIFDVYDIIGITESWLTDRISNAMSKFPNYTLFSAGSFSYWDGV